MGTRRIANRTRAKPLPPRRPGFGRVGRKRLQISRSLPRSSATLLTSAASGCRRASAEAHDEALTATGRAKRGRPRSRFETPSRVCAANRPAPRARTREWRQGRPPFRTDGGGTTSAERSRVLSGDGRAPLPGLEGERRRATRLVEGRNASALSDRRVTRTDGLVLTMTPRRRSRRTNLPTARGQTVIENRTITAMSMGRRRD